LVGPKDTRVNVLGQLRRDYSLHKSSSQKGCEIETGTKFIVTVLRLCLFFGSGLLLAPGRFLGMFYWAPVDPPLRIFGAALLAMGWLAWRMVEIS
jgi:hypothetical protein